MPKTLLVNDNFENNLISNKNNNYKDIINTNNNYERKKDIQTNCINQARKPKNSNIVNIYTIKLKKYCANLKILKKKEINTHKKQLKLDNIPVSERKKNFKKERNNTLKYEKEPPKRHSSVINKDYHHRFTTENKFSNTNKITTHIKLKRKKKI